MKKFIGKVLFKLIANYLPEIRDVKEIKRTKNIVHQSKISKKAKLYSSFKIFDSLIGEYTYIAENSQIKFTKVGKFCSIGPNFLCGWGIHPTNGISTSPMFYSTMKQNGQTLSKVNKVIEMKEINIGNDVFIGMNVTVLDGVTIGHGAVIGAGAVVSKNIPPYGIALGCPIKIVGYRFNDQQIDQLLKISWWNWDEKQLQEIEKHFEDVQTFIDKYN